MGPGLPCNSLAVGIAASGTHGHRLQATLVVRGKQRLTGMGITFRCGISHGHMDVNIQAYGISPVIKSGSWLVVWVARTPLVYTCTWQHKRRRTSARQLTDMAPARPKAAVPKLPVARDGSAWADRCAGCLERG